MYKINVISISGISRKYRLKSGFLLKIWTKIWNIGKIPTKIRSFWKISTKIRKFSRISTKIIVWDSPCRGSEKCKCNVNRYGWRNYLYAVRHMHYEMYSTDIPRNLINTFRYVNMISQISEPIWYPVTCPSVFMLCFVVLRLSIFKTFA